MKISHLLQWNQITHQHLVRGKDLRLCQREFTRWCTHWPVPARLSRSISPEQVPMCFWVKRWPMLNMTVHCVIIAVEMLSQVEWCGVDLAWRRSFMFITFDCWCCFVHTLIRVSSFWSGDFSDQRHNTTLMKWNDSFESIAHQCNQVFNE